jgi:hypothetical protein
MAVIPMKAPKDLAERIKRYRATAEISNCEHGRVAMIRATARPNAEAERYRKLAKKAQEEAEAALPPRKPPAPSA